MEKCAQCAGPLDRAQVRVRLGDRLWIERVAALACRRCNAVELTKAGRAKVARGAGVAERVLGSLGEGRVTEVEVVKVYGN